MNTTSPLLPAVAKQGGLIHNGVGLFIGNLLMFQTWTFSKILIDFGIFSKHISRKNIEISKRYQ